MRKLVAIAVAGTLLSVAATSFADVRNFNARPSNFTSGPAAVFVPLDGAGATTVNFNLTAAGRKVLTYSAECAVGAPAGNASAWVDVDIVVNGVTVAPTVGNQDAFCVANGTAAMDGWTRASITVVIQGKVGNNTVRIQIRGNGGTTTVGTATRHWSSTTSDFDRWAKMVGTGFAHRSLCALAWQMRLKLLCLEARSTCRNSPYPGLAATLTSLGPAPGFFLLLPVLSESAEFRRGRTDLPGSFVAAYPTSGSSSEDGPIAQAIAAEHCQVARSPAATARTPARKAIAQF